MKIKRCFAIIVALCIVFCSLCNSFTALAEDVSFYLQIQKYDLAEKKYVDCTAVYPDDSIRVTISSDVINNIGGMRAILNFDNSLLEVKGDSSECVIADDTAILTFAENQEKATASVIWFTNSNNISVEGKLFCFYFKAKTFTSNSTLNFKLNIVELYDSGNVDISNGNSFEKSIPALAKVISDADLQIFRKLLVIEYNQETLKNISAADMLFKSYSGTQVLVFKAQNPDLYNAYINAQNKYNELALQASQQEAQKEKEKFISRNQQIINKNLDNVTVADSDAITSLESEYNSLSPRAKLLIDQKTKDKIGALSKKLTEIKQNEENAGAAQTFKNDYAALWSMDYETLKAEETFRTMVSEAVMVYDMMLTDGVKALLSAEKDKLDKLSAWCNEIVADNEEEKKLSEEVSNFQKKWIYVLTLNSSNVEISDKSAIELMLEDLSSQSSEIQERLSAKKTAAEQLLTILETLEQETDIGENDAITDNGAAGDNTQTIIKTQTKTVKDTVTAYVGNIPKIIIVLSVILAVSFVLLLVPTGAYLYLSSKKVRRGEE
ncbi:MAG: hypothetical protein J6J39_00400 [Clostridia bacterium]|nr:hypothetical protein [Clostridia bacterium]